MSVMSSGDRLRWAVIDWARHDDGDQPPAWWREPEYVLARRLWLLLAMTCELPSGELRDYSYLEWAEVLGVTELQVLEAADLLSAMDVSVRTGSLGAGEERSPSALLLIPPALLEVDELAGAVDNALAWPTARPPAAPGGGFGFDEECPF